MDYKEEFYKNHTQGMEAVTKLFELYQSFPGHDPSYKGFELFISWLSTYAHNFLIITKEK